MKKSIAIRDYQPQNVVIDMSESLEVPFEQNKNKFRVNLPSTFGEGYVQATEFDDGVGLIEAKYILKKEFVFELEKGIVHPLKITFNLGDKYYRKFENDAEERTIESLNAEMVCSTPMNNHRYRIPNHQNIHIFSIEINRKYFEKKLELFYDELDPELIELFRDVNGVIPFNHSSVISYELSTEVNEFLQNKNFGVLKYVFEEAKLNEIITLYLQQYIDDLRSPEDKKVFRLDKYNHIQKAKEYIEKNLSDDLTVNSIASEVGVNPNQLQIGFKSMFNMSVNEFKMDKKLEFAKRLVHESNLNVSEITYEVGISSKSYFSKLFKAKYGLLPKDYIAKYRIPYNPGSKNIS